MMHKMVIPLALVCLLSTVSSSKALFGLGNDDASREQKKTSGPRLVRKYHLHIPDKKTEKELLNLLESKKWFTEDIKALERIEKVRAAGAMQLQEELREAYGIDPHKPYEFSQETGELLLLEAATNGLVKRPVMRIDDPEQRARMIQRLDDKSRLNRQVLILRELIEEQKQSLDRTQQLLDNKFDLEPNHMYNYDDKKMILYKMVPPPKNPYDNR